MQAITRALMALAAAILLNKAALSETLPYQFTKTDISITGALPTSPVDVNDFGDLIANVLVGNTYKTVIATPEGPKFKMIPFNCLDVPTNSQASSINGQQNITGTCSNALNTKILGFLRYRGGRSILLDYPGADHTLAAAINDYNQIVGHYYNPLAGQSGLFRIHGFVWSNNKFTTLDFPLPNTYTRLWGINKYGQILGEYTTFNPTTNETTAHKWFLYDKGNFILDFPESLEYVGGPSFVVTDINDAGQAIGAHNINGPWQLFIYQGGQFFDVSVPAGWQIVSVAGMNNKGNFVGSYMIQVGADKFEFHGFSATPKPAITIRQRKN